MIFCLEKCLFSIVKYINDVAATILDSNPVLHIPLFDTSHRLYAIASHNKTLFRKGHFRSINLSAIQAAWKSNNIQKGCSQQNWIKMYIYLTLNFINKIWIDFDCIIIIGNNQRTAFIGCFLLPGCVDLLNFDNIQ